MSIFLKHALAKGLRLKDFFLTDRSCLFLIEFFILLAVFFLSISKAVIEISTISALGLWVVRKVFKKEHFFLPRAVLVSYLLFFALCILSLWNANLSEWQQGSRGILKWLQTLGFFCLCAEWAQDERRARRLIGVFLASIILISVNGFYQLAHGTDFLRGVQLDPGRIIRMKGSLGAANALAAFYVFAIPLSLTLYEYSKKIRPLVVLMTALSAFGLILTFSRGAFLGLFCAGVFILILHRQWKLLTGLLLTLALPLFLIKPLYQNFLGSLNFQDITIGERIRYWAYTWEMIKDHPFLGCGLNLFYGKLPHYLPAEETYRGYAHNSYLQIWAETGLAGLLSFVYPLTKLANVGASRRPFLSSCLAAGCLAFAIQAFFDNNFYAMQPAYLFWIFWGIYMGVNQQQISHAALIPRGAANIP